MIDIWLFALLTFLPIVLGILCSKAIPIITFVISMFLIVFAGMMLVNPTITYSYALNATSNQWTTYTGELPFHPFAQIMILVLALVFIWISWADMGASE